MKTLFGTHKVTAQTVAVYLLAAEKIFTGQRYCIGPAISSSQKEVSGSEVYDMGVSERTAFRETFRDPDDAVYGTEEKEHAVISLCMAATLAADEVRGKARAKRRSVAAKKLRAAA